MSIKLGWASLGSARLGNAKKGVIPGWGKPVGPTNTVAPVLTIVGDGEPGNTLSWNNGTWTTLGTISTYTYSLLRNGAEIATSAPYEILADEEGEYQVFVTATDEFGSRTKGSNQIVVYFTPVELVAAVIALDDNSPFKPYRVSGAAFDYAQSVTLQWLRNGSPVGGQTSASYTGPATNGDEFILRTTAINGEKNLVSDSNAVIYDDNEVPPVSGSILDESSNEILDENLEPIFS